jgi:hypothetical protein
MELGPQPPRPKPKTDLFFNNTFLKNPKKRPPKCHQHIWNNKVHKQTKTCEKRQIGCMDKDRKKKRFRSNKRKVEKKKRKKQKSRNMHGQREKEKEV